MLCCFIVLLHGEKGTAVCKCKLHEAVDAQWALSLHALPADGTLLVGQGYDYTPIAHCRQNGVYRTAPVDTASLWLAYCTPQGDMLAWGTADGMWHEYVAAGVCHFAQATALPNAKESPADDVGPDHPETQSNTNAHVNPQGATQPDAPDLAQWGVQSVETDLSDNTQEDEIDQVTRYLAQFPPYAPLQQRLPASRWAQVQQPDCHYFVGLLFDADDRPTHWCYAVQGERNRPFAADAEWLSADETTEDVGYWVVYNQLD